MDFNDAASRELMQKTDRSIAMIEHQLAASALLCLRHQGKPVDYLTNVPDGVCLPAS